MDEIMADEVEEVGKFAARAIAVVCFLVVVLWSAIGWACWEVWRHRDVLTYWLSK